MKNTVSEMKYTLVEINIRLNKAEDWIKNLEDTVGKNTQSVQQTEKKKI